MPKETKTLAIRLEPELHARLTILARLADVSVTDLIRTAIETKLDALASDPAISSRAEELRQAIERDAAEQRDAIDGLFAGKAAKPSRSQSRSS